LKLNLPNANIKTIQDINKKKVFIFLKILKNEELEMGLCRDCLEEWMVDCLLG
jgi:hypothetical protein